MHLVAATLENAALMLWQTLWALTLGLGLSGSLQVFARRESLMRHFGHTDVRSVGLATFLGAVSSSCSYAAAAAANTAFKKGAALVPVLAFMFASTNLVLELGIVLWIFLGWHFVLAEAVGSFVLIGAMWLLVSLFFPKDLIEAARRHEAEAAGEAGCCDSDHGHHHHGGSDEGAAPDWRRLASWARVADAFAMDVSMLWKEVLIGFLIAGFLMAAVPPDFWRALFLPGLPAPLRLVENCVLGVLIAFASFVCSVGNLPLAAVLWSGGLGFGGVISFIYGDLIIIPLLLLYRKYYGLKAGLAIGAVLAVSMVVGGIVVDLLFHAAHLVPARPAAGAVMAQLQFRWDYTTWLDLAALIVLGLGAFLRWRAGAAPAHHVAGPMAHHPSP
jgi:uncharacterized membrane protein YraQ (UPF0718 family)